MDEHGLLPLAAIIVIGIGAHWLAWRLRIPAILPLLAAGFLIGPATGWLDPDDIFGHVLFPAVSLLVGLILFEGGLSLRIDELRKVGSALWGLVIIGPLITWLLTALAAWLLVGIAWQIALVLGAILVVTGPTVIGPLLRQVRPRGPAGTLLKWEGILTDPLGASLALLVFEIVLSIETESAALIVIGGLVRTVLAGVVLGLGGGWVLTQLLRQYWIPDYLQNAVTLMFVVAGMTVSNEIQGESGLLTVTLMGIYLANQKRVNVQHIIEFKENIRVLIIAGLFIVLAASLDMEDLRRLPWGSLVFLGVLILIIRPVCVFTATSFSTLERRDKVFLSGVAPRGIVAASVSAVFGVRLTEAGIPDAELLSPLTFIVIMGTVVVYGLTARPLAQRLELAEPNPTGLLIIGAHRWARQLAAALVEHGVPVRLVDTNRNLVSRAHRENLVAFNANILSEQAEEELDLSGIGGLLALTSNDEVNSMACLGFTDVFGRGRVYQLPPPSEDGTEGVTERLRGRNLFALSLGFDGMTDAIRGGAKFQSFELGEELSFDQLTEEFGETLVPLVAIEGKFPKPMTVSDPPRPKKEDVLLCLMLPEPKPAKKDKKDKE